MKLILIIALVFPMSIYAQNWKDLKKAAKELNKELKSTSKQVAEDLYINSGASLIKQLGKYGSLEFGDKRIGFNNNKSFTTRQIPGSRSLYKNNAPGVVLILRIEGDGFGSGSIINNDGSIITNWHVIEGQEKVLVQFYNKSVRDINDIDPENFSVANVVAADPSRDLALIKLQSAKKDMKILKLGDMNDVNIAQDVFAIGHPQGLMWSFNYGAVSGIRKNFGWAFRDSKHKANIIQHQTPINQGNSGGPLFDENGNFIGVNSMKLQESDGLNFAVGIDEVKSFFEDSKKGLFKLVIQDKNVLKLNNETPIDANENGRIDGYFSESNGVILLRADPDEDDEIDYILVDTNGDSRWDAEVYDEDKDTFFEYWTIDINGNGEFESSAIDTDKDGIPDYFL
ncbi:serine protease [Candidatus Marinimicrobia bacterium]|nr:serine protease [Candidatus Neomarinimicrobiota bacterium]